MLAIASSHPIAYEIAWFEIQQQKNNLTHIVTVATDFQKVGRKTSLKLKK